MIEWISHWLQNIILVVLLATFVDLLLPTKNLQKYAKMVLGLIVILSIITPIFSLFSKEFSIETIIQQWDKQTRSDENVPVMETLSQNQEQINQQYQEKLIAQVETSMKQHLSSVLENRFSITVQTVLLEAKIDEQQNWQIQHVQVNIQEGITKKVNNKDSEVKEIENVETVSIDSNEIKQNNSNKVDVNPQLTKEIVEVIHEQWGLNEEQITVKIEQDLS
ncbi:stage III sporulation protein AF [Tepidibacillus marianensis]|uniref:stage III sporulation protein AF n=1 Tax=Tepidibacillus marianensis TaxID=3131995 RepID=UPI0030D06801